MPGLNSTGAPDTRDYTLGRGIVRLAALTAAGLPDLNGFRDLGNAPEFNITVAVEDVRHQSSRTQLKFTDKRCTVSQEVGLSFILDEMDPVRRMKLALIQVRRVTHELTSEHEEVEEEILEED